ncbi:MAG: helix-turn-helix domain-containing protein [gamma proteobacterium symbiont of Taylorina sp.]|nr:helix-turn-helix domain-containing protein [gamma proteobacterium symbiont of Taylorina sp.]
MSKRKNKTSFRTEGQGVVVMPVVMLKSNEYIHLSLASKAVMTAMQLEWYPWRYTSIGISQIAEKAGISERTVQRSITELLQTGFINIKKVSGKKTTREYELTWLEYHEKEATFSWRKQKK